MSSTTQDLKFIDIKFRNGVLKDTILESSFRELFVEFSRMTSESSFVACRAAPNLRVLCKRVPLNGFNLLVHIGEHFEDLVLDLRSYSDSFCPFSVHEITNNLNNYLMNHVEKADDSIYTKLNQILNGCYKHFQGINSKLEKPQNNQEVQPVQETLQPLQPTPQIPPQPSITYDPTKLYIKKTNVTVVQTNIKCVIPNEYRKMIKLHGENRNGINRSVHLAGIISIIVLRKNKNKSVLRHFRNDKTKMILKIGTGQIFDTESTENIEWRVLHTEENVKHIENAFTELNKWFEEHKKKFAMKQLKDKEEEEKRKLEEEKRKLEEERKRKEEEEKIIQLIKTENFAELK